MEENIHNEKRPKKKSFFTKVFEKLDKELGKKAKSQTCCCKPSDKRHNSCCS